MDISNTNTNGSYNYYEAARFIEQNKSIIADAMAKNKMIEICRSRRGWKLISFEEMKIYNNIQGVRPKKGANHE